MTRAAAALALVALVGCGKDGPRGAARATAPRPHRGADAGSAAGDADCSADAGSAERGAGLAHAPSSPDPRLALDQSCESCHAEIAAEWRRSAHALADVHPVYRAEHALTNAAWCNACHAPFTAPLAQGAAAERGVGCTSCHAPHDGEPHPEAAPPHDCATCHDAPFPTRAESPHAHYAPDQRLQRTREEWLTSAAHARGDTCTTCHFAPVVGADGTTHTSHTLPGARDATLWRDALSITAEAHRTSRGVRVRLTLRVAHAGHAVPTGDMNRRLAIHVDGAPDRILMRRFTPGPHGTRELSDDRVPADGTRRILTLDLPRTRHIRWSIAWLALDQELAAQRDLDATLVEHVVVAGDLVPQ